MKTNKNIINDYKCDFDCIVKNENKETETTAPNDNPTASTIEEQLAAIHNRIDRLAMFVGIPHVLPLDGNLALYPARKNGERKVSEYAVSYIVDLTPYRHLFSEVRFKAMTSFCNDREIVRGIIVDEQGNVECASDNRFGTSNPWTRLPISEKSSYLVASVPLKDGNPLWVPTSVEFLPKGVAQEVAEITDSLYHNIIDIENRAIPFKRRCEEMFSKLSGNEVHLM